MTVALLTAAGSGTRMGQDIPKQFMHVENKPIIIHTMEAFQNHPSIDAIIVVTIPSWIDVVKAYAKQFNIDKLRWVVPGGETGQDSIYNGLKKAQSEKRQIHFLPPYRHDTMITIMDLLGIHPSQQKESASLQLIRAVVKMRATKEPQEIEAIERACDVGYAMHTTAQLLIKPGVTERFIGGQVDGIARSLAQGVSFATIFSQHGEIMHGNPSDAPLEAGRLALCDAGCELDDYCSDNTRTMPVSGKFTQKQLEIYSIVEQCHDYVLDVA